MVAFKKVKRGSKLVPWPTSYRAGQVDTSVRMFDFRPRSASGTSSGR